MFTDYRIGLRPDARHFNDPLPEIAAAKRRVCSVTIREGEFKWDGSATKHVLFPKYCSPSTCPTCRCEIPCGIEHFCAPKQPKPTEEKIPFGAPLVRETKLDTDGEVYTGTFAPLQK